MGDISKAYRCYRVSITRLLKQYYGKYIPKYSGKTFYRGGYYIK